MTGPSRYTLQADLERYQQAGDFAAQAETLMTLANMAQNWTSELIKDAVELRTSETFSLAIGLYTQAATAYQTASDMRGRAAAMGKVCQVLILDNRSQEFEVVGMYHAVIDLHKQIGDLSGQINLYIELGERFRQLKHWAYEQALECAEALGDLRRQAYISYHLGRLHMRDSQPFRSYIRRAVFLYRKLGDQVNEARIYLELGQQYSYFYYENAQKCLRQAYKMFKALGERELFVSTLDAFMEMAQKRNDYPTYQRYHEEKLPYLQSDDKKLKALSSLIALALKHGIYADARYAYQQCVVLMARRGGEAWYYWEWGEMEYHKAGRHEMGIALCQWAATLLQNHYGWIVYQKKLDTMRRNIPYRHKGFGHE